MPKPRETHVTRRQEELTAQAVEPLLPIEKKLIGWSLGLGLALLAVLIAVNHFVPIRI